MGKTVQNSKNGLDNWIKEMLIDFDKRLTAIEQRLGIDTPKPASENPPPPPPPPPH
jgi:hypothetical protein